MSHELEPLCSFAKIWNFCPGDTFVNAFFSAATGADGPCGGVTVASTVTFKASLSAVSASSSFSDKYSSSLLLLSGETSLSSIRDFIDSNSAPSVANEPTLSLISPAALLSSLRSHGTCFSSSPSLAANPGRLVSIPSKKSFSWPPPSVAFGKTESVNL